MNAVGNDISLITVMALAALMPFVIAVGTCYIKFSVVFTLVRNGLGLQQVPSNLIANAIALMLAFFVMQPIIVGLYDNYTSWDRPIDSVQEVVVFMDANLADYRAYLFKYSDPQLLAFFERARLAVGETPGVIEPDQHTMFALLPAYALSELTDAFRIGFYLYLPFVVVDLVVSSILLSLGMMMMSPVTVSAPIKLILFVAMDGWSMISQGLVRQYLDVAA